MKGASESARILGFLYTNATSTRGPLPIIHLTAQMVVQLASENENMDINSLLPLSTTGKS